MRQAKAMKYRVTTGWMRPAARRMSFMTPMICPEASCNHVWNASRIDGTCPKCGCGQVMPLSKFDAGALHLGRRVNHG